MNNILFRKVKLGRRSVCVVLCFLLITTSLVAAMGTSRNNTTLGGKSSSMVESLSYSFAFLEPELQTTAVSNSEYTLIDMSGCMAIAKQAGEPMMPVKFIKLLIPPMKTVTNVNVVGTPVEPELEDFDLVEKPVFPYQNPVPFGGTPEEFVINNEVYESSVPYPSNIYDDYHIGYCRGYTILDVALNPVQYIPSEGRLFYYPELAVTIDFEDSDYVNQFFRDNPDDKAWVENLVYNPEITDMYPMNAPTFFDYPGGLCDPTDDYDYVIITTTYNGLDYWDTSSTTPYNWESLMDKHEADDGLSCTLVTIEDIDDCEDYQNDTPIFNDLQAHIREFCKDAYQDWGTSYIFVGGDDEWIPARHMKYSYESNVDSDIYWSNLDSTFNEDHDYYWGEEGDAGFDLYAELFIGRITCDTPQDVSNWMKKSFYYADSLETDYLDNAAFYGGDTGWPCQGDDFIDFGAIKGTDDWLGPNPGDHGPYPSWLGFLYGFETWNEENPDDEYDLSVKWTAEPPNPGWQGGSTSQAISKFREAINEDRVTLINGVAHANADMSLDVYSSSWESQYTNTKPFFIHDFGCHCGDMDARDDGVLHSMLFHSDTELAFACIYHTGYGWGSFMDTNSSSALFMKLFNDYLFDLENSGYPTNWQMGKAMAWAKDAMAPTIDWTYSSAPGSWRGTIQMCLLFGDPAQKLKNPHPNLPPETPTKPDGPDTWAQFGEATFTSTAIDPEDNSISYWFDWGDETNTGWLGPYASGQKCEASHSWIEVGDYQVKVRVQDEHYGQSLRSEPATISIIENNPPEKPMISGPKSGNPRKLLTFTFNSTDPEGHDLYYMVAWGDGCYMDYTGPYANGEEVTFSHAWGEAGDYTIIAKVMDQYGAKSPQNSFKLTLTKSRAVTHPILLNLLEKLMDHFPLLELILTRIVQR